MNSIPFSDDYKDHADQKERCGRAIVYEVVHSKDERTHNQKESTEQG